MWERGEDHIKVYGDYRNTFKPAAFDFSLAENEGVLEPETAGSIEGGVKIRALDQRITAEASVFRMDLTNLVTATVVNGLPALINSGESRFQGVELAGDAVLRPGLSARGTYSFHDATFVDFVQAFDGVPTQLAGKRFEMSARHLVSGGLIFAPGKSLSGSLIVKHTGDRYLNKRNTALAEPFTTVDVGVGYRFGEYEIRADGRNLSDRRDPVSESELGDAQYLSPVCAHVPGQLRPPILILARARPGRSRGRRTPSARARIVSACGRSNDTGPRRRGTTRLTRRRRVPPPRHRASGGSRSSPAPKSSAGARSCRE